MTWWAYSWDVKQYQHREQTPTDVDHQARQMALEAPEEETAKDTRDTVDAGD